MKDAQQRPSHAQSARTILARVGTGALGTISTRPPGFPYTSVVKHALTEEGDPLLLLSDLAQHTTNLKADPRASLLVVEDSAGGDALAKGRVSVMGTVEPVPAERAEDLSKLMVSAHPGAALTLGFSDFNLYRLTVVEARYIGGFGRMSWLRAAAYKAAQADPMTHVAAGIVDHMNEDHADALVLYARHHGGLSESEAATMVSIDSLGFDLLVKSSGVERRVRIGFEAEVVSATGARKTLVRMVQQARAAQQGDK